MNLKKIGKVFTSKFVRTGPSSYKTRICRAAVSQWLSSTDLKNVVGTEQLKVKWLEVYFGVHRWHRKGIVSITD